MVKKKIALMTPTFCGFDGISRLAEQKAIKLSKNNEVTVVTFQYDNTIIPRGYKILILANKFMNQLSEDNLIDGTLLKV